jgi:peptide deformylase
MVLPITAYGHSILRKKCEDIASDYPGLEELISNMWETLYGSHGVGLAAPQVNRPIRIFLVDTLHVLEQMDEDERKDYPGDDGVKAVFINARILDLDGTPWAYEEGCLSIPQIREDVDRPESVRISYLDEKFQPQEKTFTGLTARVIQHEYDHIEGKLFIDYLKPLKKRLLKKRLSDISKGKVSVDYKMLFPK